MTVKQKRLQSAFVFSSRGALCLALCFFGTGILLGTGVSAQLPPDPQSQTHLAVIAGNSVRPGTYVAGIAIAMAPGSHTYWKTPGDAGVPPVFDFAGSRNVRSVHVLYPEPRRIGEEGLEAFGYLDDVTFPVEVVAADPAAPVVLSAAVTYAVCNKICIPAKGHGSVTLAPGATDADASRVDAALARVPKPASPEQRAALAVARDAGAAKPSWTLTWRGAAPVADIFADAPEGTYLATRKTGAGTWRLVAEQLPAGATTVPVALTLARAAHPLAVDETLDIGVAAR